MAYVVLAAWLVTVVVVLLGNGFGDAVLTGRWRTLSGVTGSWLGDYRSAVVAVVKGQRPATATVHALLAGVTTVLTLVACVLATW